MRWPDRDRRAVISLLVAGGAWQVLLTTPMRVLAASPTPEAAGDPRSAGEGPGLVGDPLMAILVVALIGVLALGATLAWVRATGGPGRTPS
jgi:hypothetical protein